MLYHKLLKTHFISDPCASYPYSTRLDVMTGFSLGNTKSQGYSLNGGHFLSEIFEMGVEDFKFKISFLADKISIIASADDISLILATLLQRDSHIVYSVSDNN